jgi:TRAP-type C4-dicarboxylate transport system permease small subunit
VVCALLLSLLVVTVFAQVLTRYVFLAPLVWAEELAVFCFSWVVMLGIALGARERAHLVCDFLPRGAGGRLDGVTARVAGLAVAVAAAVFIVYGSQFAVLGLRRYSFATGYPMTALYIAMPVSGLLMLLFVAEQVVQSRVDLASPGSIRGSSPAELGGPPPGVPR